MATVYINGVKAKRMAIGTTEIANILKGTSDPSSSIGSNGQLYLKYIPDDYTVLSYIQSNQSNGRQYIDTGIVPTFNTRVQIKYRFMNAHTANDVLIGSRIEGASDKRFFPASIDEGTVLKDRYVMGSQSITHSSSTQGIREVDFNNSNHQVVYEGVAIDTFTPSVYSGNTNTMYLFGAHDTNGLNFEASAKLYYCRIEDTSTGQTLKEYIPVKRNSDDEIGLYDTVSGTFFENEGSGAFTAGDVLGTSVIQSSFAKVNNQWQDLIGTDIDDIQSGGETPKMDCFLFKDGEFYNTDKVELGIANGVVSDGVILFTTSNTVGGIYFNSSTVDGKFAMVVSYENDNQSAQVRMQYGTSKVGTSVVNVINSGTDRYTFESKAVNKGVSDVVMVLKATDGDETIGAFFGNQSASVTWKIYEIYLIPY